MAAAADIADKERAGPGRPVPAHLQGHHRPEAAHRNRRREGRTFQVRETRALSNEKPFRPCLAIFIALAQPEGHHEAVAFGSGQLGGERGSYGCGRVFDLKELVISRLCGFGQGFLSPALILQ